MEEVAGILTVRSTRKPLRVQPSMLLASRSLRRVRFRKKATMLERKY